MERTLRQTKRGKQTEQQSTANQRGITYAGTGDNCRREQEQEQEGEGEGEREGGGRGEGGGRQRRRASEKKKEVVSWRIESREYEYRMYW